MRSGAEERAVRFGPPIEARPGLERVRAALTRTLDELEPAEWERPTVCAPWLVRDIVAHVLGDDLGRLSRARDGHAPTGRRAGEPLGTFLHRHNQQWVDATARVSPRLLRDLLAVVTPQLVAYWWSADPDAFGEAVSWADPGPAPVWLDCARELTEYWTHLHQIFEATGRPALPDDELRHTVLDTFLRALPLTLDRAGDGGEAVTVRVPGPAGGSWTCVRSAGGWGWPVPGGSGRSVPGVDPRPGTVVTVDADTLWRVCTRGIEPAEAIRRARVDGDPRLAAATLSLVSIIR